VEEVAVQFRAPAPLSATAMKPPMRHLQNNARHQIERSFSEDT